MNIGDRVNLHGFEIVAHANSVYDEKRFIVTHNNSSHYHLWMQDQDEHLDARDDRHYATLLNTFCYADLPESMLWYMFQKALIQMCKFATVTGHKV